MKTQSQNQWVAEKLLINSFVTRNQAFRKTPPIGRLASRINDLKKHGFKITGKQCGTDYRYEYVK